MIRPMDGAGRATPRRRVRLRAIAAVIVAGALLGACAPESVRDSVTAPVAPQAAAIEGLFWFSVIVGTLVWLVVVALLAVPIVRSLRGARPDDGSLPAGDGTTSRRDVPAGEADGPMLVADPALADEAEADHKARSRLVWIGGIVAPAIILLALLGYSSVVGRATAHVPEDGELVIEVVGHTFWWEVTYPDLDITTANEIHVPVDQPVRLQLTTEDVIHSFWIPRLHGKVDMIPGTENTLTFTATETGRFRGQCAEFCGIAHAQMVAYVEAQAPDAFDDWVDGQQQDAAAPATAGQEVFLEAGCAACHTVAGTEAVGGVGPDLTHLASRETLAAGIVPNTRDSLAALILDPWGVKPGIAMPPAELDDAQLAALLDYLQELQ